jgi:hypothetical protein
METAMIQTPEFERTQTTDPREAKLGDIIEKAKANLHKMLDETQHEFSSRIPQSLAPIFRFFKNHRAMLSCFRTNVPLVS